MKDEEEKEKIHEQLDEVGSFNYILQRVYLKKWASFKGCMFLIIAGIR